MPYRILVVEDNDDIRATLIMSLELEGYECLEAVDGIDALAVLERLPVPDLIMLDMLMPRMNGWEFVETIHKDPRAHLAKIPIVAVTATSEKVQKAPGEIQAVIRKPVDLDELYRTLSGILAANRG